MKGKNKGFHKKIFIVFFYGLEKYDVNCYNFKENIAYFLNLDNMRGGYYERLFALVMEPNDFCE